MKNFNLRSLRGKVFLLFTLFYSLTKIASGASVGNPYISGSGVDQYGAYIEFVIDIRDQSGSHSAGNLQEVTTGHLSYNGIWIATFSASSSSWDDQGINVQINQGYAIASNGSGWTGMLSSVSGNQNVSNGSGGEATLTIRWYIPQYMLGQTLNFSSHEYVTGYYVTIGGSDDGALGDQGNQNWSGSSSASFSIPAPSFGFTTSKSLDSMSVNYSYVNTTIPSGQANNYTIKHWMDSNTGETVTDNSNVNPSGSLNVAMSNSFVTHNFTTTVTGQGGYMTYSLTTPVSVPPYIWPASLNAQYNGRDSVMVSWQVPAATGSGYITGDNFEVQRSTDPTFATNVTEVTQSDKYNPGQTSYSIWDNLSNITGGTTVYYRLRRTATQSDWGWNNSVNGNVSINMNTTQVADTVRDTTINGSPEAVVTWQPFSGVWTSGTTFTLIKFNKTTGAQAATINLTESQARSGKYIDQSVPYCNEFIYSIQVTLGGGYSSPAEVTIPGSILAVNIGTISDLTASKGYFPDHVNLQWNSQGQFDDYIVERKIYGDASGNFVQIATVPGASTNLLQTTDATGQPGVYYEYMVVGAVKCNNETKYSLDTLYTIGFRSPTGNIYGRVTYANGQAVEDVSVRLQNNDNPQLGTSVYLNGQDSSYLIVDSLNAPFTDSAFTAGAWIDPSDSTPKNEVIFSQGGQYELGFNGNGQVYFTYNDSTVTGPYVNPDHGWIHLTGIHSKDSLSLMINDSVIARISDPFSAPSHVSHTVYIGRNAAGNNYKGYIDEMRVWNVAETPQQIAQNYTRLLTGGETGLAAYWRFDETINDEFYDNSYQSQSNTYNQNDGVMNPNYVVHSTFIPSPDQLSLKAYTDSSGNYMISGVPYTGNGTTYTIVPLFETHQFSPSSSNRFVSATSSTYNVNFTDNSSFPVTGYVFYNNSTVPVPGVEFMIDGKYAQASNGSILQTDATGHFSISVPVGYHEVKAVKNNHVFVNGGAITDQFGNELNYQSAWGPVQLYDSTTIRFIGRVAGGAVQENYPLGFSLSKNNLGKVLSVTLSLPITGKYFLTQGTTDSVLYVDHLTNHDSLTAYEQDTSKTEVVYSPNKITIYPDAATGEFEANVLPLQYVASAAATGWTDILNNNNTPVSVDFTNAFIPKYSIYSYKDSTQSNAGNWNYANYLDTVTYDASYKFIKRVTPNVSVVQMSAGGQAMSYFGDSVYIYQTLAGGNQNIPVINKGTTGQAQYLFGYPVFTQNASYKFEVKAFEPYTFYDSVKPDGTLIPAVQNGQPKVDNVPTTDGLVSVYDGISNSISQADTMSLDSKGTVYYSFTAGDPEIQAPGTKDLAVSVKFGQATNVNWNWLGNPQLQAFVMGGKLSGTDFVTAGPNKILMVLRDPPGNNSYSYVNSGSTISSSSTYTGSVDQTGDETLITKIGTKLVTFTGIGVGTINSVVATNGITVGAHHEEHYTGTNTKTTTTTFTTQFQTSSDPGFVGAPADLYVGYSTNITYGLSNNLIVIPGSALEATDVIIYPANGTGSSPFLVVEREGLNFGQTFGTLFAYPQEYILNTLIPNLTKIRNTMLLPPSTSAAAAQQAANTNNTEVYVSKLAASDPNFGKSNDDVTAFGSKAQTDPFGNGESYTIYFPQSSSYRTDTVLTLNQYVKSWQGEIARNEKEKLNATLLQNYSFHAGSPIGYSETTDYHYDTTNSFNFVLSANLVNSIDTKFNGAGAEFDINESLGTQQGGSFEQSSDTTTTMGFELASNGGSEYLSVDVDKASDGGFTFKTKGGATGCPYEPASATQFYQPGTVLNQPTVQIEVPKIKVNNPVVNNVPSTQKASYTLYLSNESQVQTTATFTLYYANTDSVQGATIAVDGSSIANGRTYYVPAGQTISVVLTLAKGPTAMNYNNIPIILQSSCDTSVYDQVLISAHFVPSCSNVDIASPNNNWVVNTSSPVDPQGNPYLPVTLNNFDETNSLFDHIELQYKPSQNSQWITAMSFYPDSASYNAAQGQKALITNAQGINYNLVMNNASFNDGPYDLRGLAVCDLGSGNYITTPSSVASGIKDVSAPVLFGNPQPANGILGIGDNVQLTFDKPIAGGLLTPTDFQVTGIRNGTPSDHSVSIDLDGKSDYTVSEFSKNLTGRSFTAEMWVLPDSMENGTVFSQGNMNESIELAFTNDNHLQVTVGKQVIKSPNPLNFLNGQWSHVALEYNAVDSTVSAFYNFQEVINEIKIKGYNGTGPVEFGTSISQQGNYFAGKMQNARLWTQDIPATTLQLNSLTRLSGSENALLSYYPMDEGKGNILFDKAHGNNMQLTGTWSTPPGKAMSFNGNGYVKINTGTIPITSRMDYTVGLWFKGQPGQTNAALLSNGRGDGMDGSGSKNLFYLGFENSRLTFINNGFEVQLDSNYLDNQWHHVALAVNRISGVGQFFVDGQMKKYFNAQNLGGIEAPYAYAGARVWYDSVNAVTPHIDQYFTGNIDEVRIWNSYLNQSVLDNIYDSRLNGDELGLLAYYPFDTYIQFQGQPFLNFTMSDMIADSNYLAPDAVAVNAQQTDESAPVKNPGPVANLNFNYVVNNNSLIINLLEPPQAIDKTIVTFRVKGAQDQDGNTMQSPVTWTAYIDQNPLKWGDNELNLTMKVDTPIQFTSYINNSSGSNQNFRIDNLPGWLTASPSNGTIGPEGKQLITFTVNPGLNVGAYNDIAEMINANNETQGLSINLTVQGKTPDWKVNPADFKYNMTVFGKIREDGIFSSNPGDILAAFANGKCVGVAYNTYSSTTDLWYAFLTIYSDSIRYNNLEFRIWDAGNGKIYEGIPSTPVPFVSDTVIGTPLNPVVFDGKEMLFHNLSLNQGWNWISFNLYNANLNSIGSTLQYGNWQSGDIVKNNDMGFDQYSLQAGWVGYLNGFNNISMFMLQAGNAQTLSVNGTAVDVTKTGIPLKGNRWNYISYLPQGNMTVKEALAGYEATDGDIIKSQTGFDMYAAPNGWVGNLTYMEPGKGYMLYRNTSTDTTFYYPNLPGILGVAVGKNSPDNTDLLSGHTVAYNPNSDQIPVAGNFSYANNMTMIAVTGREFHLLPGDKVLAYSGKELIGKAEAIPNPVTKGTSFFMNIAGDEPKQVTFKIERNGDIEAVSSSVLDYARNLEIGTVEEPYKLHFKSLINGVAVFPNPFSDHVNIYATLSGGSSTHTIQISVYDAAGRLVYQNTPVPVNGTVYQTTWNGRGNNGADCSPGIYFININIDGVPHTQKVFKYE
jgi:hypothetical protein